MKAFRKSQPEEPAAAPQNTFTMALTPAQAKALHDHLQKHNFVPREVPHAEFAYATPEINVAYYARRGRLVVQGKGARDFVEFTLEPEILQSARLGYEEVLSPELSQPRLGVDESGKGDFFGPLCVAGVYVNAETAKTLQKAGVRDSKNISSDAQVARLARLIRDTPGCVHRVVSIGNAAYNRLYREMESVNRILAWGHARVIENLRLAEYQMHPPPALVVLDQFASTEETVKKALMPLGRQIKIVQRHKAESDVAVAAASILARDEFVRQLKALGKQYGVPLPKGASEAVEKAGRQLVERHGSGVLAKVCKTHFRNYHRILGLPEPPRVEWKGPRSSRPSTRGAA